MFDGARACGAARRRRERRLPSWWRQKQQSAAAAVAEALRGVWPLQFRAPRGQRTADAEGKEEALLKPDKACWSFVTLLMSSCRIYLSVQFEGFLNLEPGDAPQLADTGGQGFGGFYRKPRGYELTAVHRSAFFFGC